MHTQIQREKSTIHWMFTDWTHLCRQHQIKKLNTEITLYLYFTWLYLLWNWRLVPWLHLYCSLLCLQGYISVSEPHKGTNLLKCVGWYWGEGAMLLLAINWTTSVKNEILFLWLLLIYFSHTQQSSLKLLLLKVNSNNYKNKTNSFSLVPANKAAMALCNLANDSN